MRENSLVKVENEVSLAEKRKRLQTVKVSSMNSKDRENLNPQMPTVTSMETVQHKNLLKATKWPRNLIRATRRLSKNLGDDSMHKTVC